MGFSTRVCAPCAVSPPSVHLLPLTHGFPGLPQPVPLSEGLGTEHRPSGLGPPSAPPKAPRARDPLRRSARGPGGTLRRRRDYPLVSPLDGSRTNQASAFLRSSHTGTMFPLKPRVRASRATSNDHEGSTRTINTDTPPKELCNAAPDTTGASKSPGLSFANNAHLRSLPKVRGVGMPPSLPAL